MSDDVLQQIEADIAEAERLITECRLQIAARKSAGRIRPGANSASWRWSRGGCCYRISGRKLSLLIRRISLQRILSRPRSAKRANAPHFRSPQGVGRAA